MAAEAAERLGDRVDQLVKQSMARHIVRNMGSGIYNTFVKPQLTKEARECPVMLIWQLLAEARKVSEVDLSKRYTALLQPQRAKTVAGLTALYQHQIDEETELRMHEFVTDKKAQPLKEAFLELGCEYPVLLTKIEIAWQGAKDDPPAALNLVKAEIVSFFSTQQEGPKYTPAGGPSRHHMHLVHLQLPGCYRQAGSWDLMLLIRCAGSSNPGAVAHMVRSANSAMTQGL